VAITRPLPTPPLQSQTNEVQSPEVEDSTISGKYSPVFRRVSVGNTKVTTRGTKSSYSESSFQPQMKLSRNKGNNSRWGLSSQQHPDKNPKVAQPDHAIGRLTIHHDSRRKSAVPRLSSKLNPFAASFKPETSSKPRAISLPDIQHPAPLNQANGTEKPSPYFIYDSSTSAGGSNHPNGQPYGTSSPVNHHQRLPFVYSPGWMDGYLQNGPPRFLPAYTPFDGQTMTYPYFDAQPITPPNLLGVTRRHMHDSQTYFPSNTPQDDFATFQIMQSTPVINPEQQQAGYQPVVQSTQIPVPMISPLSRLNSPRDVTGAAISGFFHPSTLMNQSMAHVST
jgi:hypothetical protein